MNLAATTFEAQRPYVVSHLASKALAESNVVIKAQLVTTLSDLVDQLSDDELLLACSAVIVIDEPGLPMGVVLVAPDQVPRRRLGSVHGCAAMLHAVAHIEYNAINLALDVLCRFPSMPAQFYRDWTRVAKEESEHFHLVSARLAELNYSYGDFPAHQGLWEMAIKTKHDVLARMAMVPRLLEARGLDVTPGLQARMLAAGEKPGAALLDIIFRDEVGHVQVGNHWFAWLCKQRGLNRQEVFRVMLIEFDAPKHRGEMNVDARLKAGFDQHDLDVLLAYSI